MIASVLLGKELRFRVTKAVDGLLDIADQKESSGLNRTEQFFLYPVRVLVFVHINLGKVTPVLTRNFTRPFHAALVLLPEKRKCLMLEVRKVQQVFFLFLCPVPRGEIARQRDQCEHRLRIAARNPILLISEVLCRLFERLLPEFAERLDLLRKFLVAVLFIRFQAIETLKRAHGPLCRRIAFRATKRPDFFKIAVHGCLITAEPSRLAAGLCLLRKGQEFFAERT